MILGERFVVADETNCFRVYFLGDLHMNLRSFDWRGVREFISTVEADPAASLFVMGDVTDARPREHRFFDPGMLDKRFSLDSLDYMEDVCREEVVELLRPVVDKVVGVIEGNHHRPGFVWSVVRRLNELGGDVQELRNRAWVRFLLDFPDSEARGRRGFSVFATHVDSGSRKPGAQLNRELDSVSDWVADVYAFAHSHRGSYFRKPRFVLGNRGALRAVRRDALLVNAGAWLSNVSFGADSYADRKNLPVQSDDKFFIEVSLSPGGDRSLLFRPRLWANER